MHPLLNSFPIYMRAPDFRWGNMWAVHAAWVKKGFIFSSALWLACMMMPPVSMNWGSFVIG